MLHSIQSEKLGPMGKAMTDAIQACVHCGFCLSACPTYGELAQEMDTPRGRIVLMKGALEGNLPWKAAQVHVDRCLGCLACEPACPSGVRYRDLVNPFRAVTHDKLPRSAGERLRRTLLAQVLPFPVRFRFAAAVGMLAKRFPFFVPRSARPMLDLLPAQLPLSQKWPLLSQAQGPRRSRVALLTGCVQQIVDPDINTATIEVLNRNGVEVVVPSTQSCCGGLAWHTGDLSAAQRFAKRNLDTFPLDVDAIVTNAAGCGSTMREYDLILRGTDFEGRAEKFRSRVVDVSVFLFQFGLRPITAPTDVQKIAYQDACHLAHAQNVMKEPRELLRSIPGVSLLEIASPHLCCGSAGSYNIEQPEIAASLGEKKARAVTATGAQLMASGNVGCLNQLRFHLARIGSPLKVRHTMQILRDAYASADRKRARPPL
jgi:glycolate oxidase iron-sulfur subunit